MRGHKFDKIVSCPGCLNTLRSFHALAAHCEQEGKKCTFQHSDMYGVFIKQLTWKLIEVTGNHKEDGTKKYGNSQEGKQEYGLMRPGHLKPTFGQQQVYGSKQPPPRTQSDALQRVEHNLQETSSAAADWPSLRDVVLANGSNAGYHRDAASQATDRSNNLSADDWGQSVQRPQQKKIVDSNVWTSVHRQIPSPCPKEPRHLQNQVQSTGQQTMQIRDFHQQQQARVYNGDWTADCRAQSRGQQQAQPSQNNAPSFGHDFKQTQKWRQLAKRAECEAPGSASRPCLATDTTAPAGKYHGEGTSDCGVALKTQ